MSNSLDVKGAIADLVAKHRGNHIETLIRFNVMPSWSTSWSLSSWMGVFPVQNVSFSKNILGFECHRAVSIGRCAKLCCSTFCISLALIASDHGQNFSSS